MDQVRTADVNIMHLSSFSESGYQGSWTLSLVQPAWIDRQIAFDRHYFMVELLCYRLLWLLEVWWVYLAINNWIMHWIWQTNRRIIFTKILYNMKLDNIQYHRGFLFHIASVLVRIYGIPINKTEQSKSIPCTHSQCEKNSRGYCIYN